MEGEARDDVAGAAIGDVVDAGNVVKMAAASLVDVLVGTGCVIVGVTLEN